MNKQELKKILKPLIKECIKEVIFDDGVLSGIISEVMRGVGEIQINETPERKIEPQRDNRLKQTQLQEQKKKMMDSIGKEAFNGVNLFEGTTPTPSAPAGSSGPLSGTAPGDPGVDLSQLMGSSGVWKRLAGN
tara:strand:- start:76 stop:474 length:399 start_codon:yes stop_codon:yes gene_type:complete